MYFIYALFIFSMFLLCSFSFLLHSSSVLPSSLLCSLLSLLLLFFSSLLVLPLFLFHSFFVLSLLPLFSILRPSSNLRSECFRMLDSVYKGSFTNVPFDWILSYLATNFCYCITIAFKRFVFCSRKTVIHTLKFENI